MNLLKVGMFLGGVAFFSAVLAFGIGVWLPHSMRHTVGSIIYSSFALALLGLGIASAGMFQEDSKKEE